MRVTVHLPDDLAEEVRSRSDDVSAYVTEALRDRIEREDKRRARRRILKSIQEREGSGMFKDDAEEQLHRQRRRGDRTQQPDG